eukprot:829029-Rhodomonas_salina.1
MRRGLGFELLPTRTVFGFFCLLSMWCVRASDAHLASVCRQPALACQPACLLPPSLQGSSFPSQERKSISEQQQEEKSSLSKTPSPQPYPSSLSRLHAPFRALRGGMDPDTLPSEYEVSKEDLYDMSNSDADDASSSSSFDTEQDDPRPHEAIITPALHIYKTLHCKVPFLEVWPGDGALPSVGDRVRVRWNIAKHMLALYDAEFGGHGRPWKGDWKVAGSSPPAVLRTVRVLYCGNIVPALLRIAYAMRPILAYALPLIVLRVAYAMSGTEIADAATR